MDEPDVPGLPGRKDSTRPEAAQAVDQTRSDASIGRQGHALPQFALDAANRQVARLSAALAGAADTIDELGGGVDPPLPEAFKGFAANASGTLRDLADRAGEQDASQFVRNLQRIAASHPVATAGIGAAIGAVLGLVLVRLGSTRDGEDASLPT